MRAAVDSIGYLWYSMAGMPPTFSVGQNTYIIKTQEGGFAKFQPQSFTGTTDHGEDNGKNFVMNFVYYYEAPPTP
jgi:hypothetical protein